MATPELTSLKSPRVTAARRLAKRSFRGKERRFLVEGPQAVREAMAHLVEVYVTPEAAARHADIVAAARAAGAPVLTATDEVVAEMSDTVTPQGIVGLCRFLDTPFEEI
ncbi:RNA methyltransferase substrate-binding domain-containing protein, partial [Streptomyces sp. 2MCAF27]